MKWRIVEGDDPDCLYVRVDVEIDGKPYASVDSELFRNYSIIGKGPVFPIRSKAKENGWGPLKIHTDPDLDGALQIILHNAERRLQATKRELDTRTGEA